MEEQLPLQEIGHHPAVLVFIGNFGGDATNTENLSIEREIRRTMLPTTSVAALMLRRRRGMGSY